MEEKMFLVYYYTGISSIAGDTFQTLPQKVKIREIEIPYINTL